MTAWVVSLGLLSVFVLGFLIIFPILAFVDCVRNPGLTTPSKIAFGSLIFFTWTMGACVYGVFGTKQPLYRTMALLSICFVAGSWLAIKPLKEHQQKLQKEQAELRSQIQTSQKK